MSMKSSISNTFCSYPFTDLAIKQYEGSTLQSAWPCCMMGNKTAENHYDRLGIDNVDKLTPDQIFNHPRMNQLRENLLNGVKDPACSVCWEQENKGLISFRQFNTIELTEQEIQNPQLSIIDITTSNICNLRCRMCAPKTSHSLMIDQKYFKENGLDEMYSKASSGNWSNMSGTALTVTDSIQWQWLITNTDKITTIKASGGEPFYDRRVIELIDTYIANDDAKNTTLSFHTNGTMFTDELIEKLNKFKANAHTFSIDGFEKTYDYIRFPATFDEIDSKIKNYIKKINNQTQLHVALVVSSLNLLSLADFINWTGSLSKLGDFCLHVHFAEINPHARGTHISRLPVSILEESARRLKVVDHSRSVNNLLSMIKHAIEHNSEDKQRMLNEIIPFDLSRSQTYTNYLDPILVDWLSS